jgi:ABC-type bacteriocin/lantibiotic exporter with double-glycine peptidase domain
MQVAQHEAGIIWHFLWECGDMIFVPFDFVYGMVFLYFYMGVSMFSGFLMYSLIMFVNFQTERVNRKSDVQIGKIERKKGAKIHESFEYSKTLKLFGWQKSFEKEVDKLRKEAREIHNERSRRGMLARNITGVVSEFLPLSIFFTFILMGHEVSLSLFLVCSALIDKIRGPLDRFMRMHNSFKHMDRAMLKIHRLLTIDEIQKNIVQENPVADLTEG